MPPRIDDTTNERQQLARQAYLTPISLRYYGSNIYNNVLTGQFAHLRRSCLVPTGNFNDNDELKLIVDNFINEKNKSVPDISAQPRLVDAGFCAYLVWMSKNKFEYRSDQAPPDEFFDVPMEHDLDYTIFFRGQDQREIALR